MSNNAGVDDWGLGLLLGAGRLRRMVASYVGENQEFARQYLAGELEVELTPQGTLAERMRAGGSGSRRSTPPPVAAPRWPRAGCRGATTRTATWSWPPPKDTRTFETKDGPKEFVLEEAIVADFGLVRAAKGDRHGNLVYRDSARNFNPLAAMCGRVTIAEVEELVEPGSSTPTRCTRPASSCSGWCR